MLADPRPLPPQPNNAVAVKDPHSAPLVNFGASPNFGCVNGIINVTLVVGRHLANGQGRRGH